MYLSSNPTNLLLSLDKCTSLHLQSSLMMKMNGRSKRSLIQNCVITNCGIKSTGLATLYQRTLGSQCQIWPMLQISSNNFTSTTHPNLLNKSFETLLHSISSIYNAYITIYFIFYQFTSRFNAQRPRLMGREVM